MSTSQNVSRRQFLPGMAGAAGGVMAFPNIISSSALGKAGNVAPSERIATWFGREIRFNPDTEEIIGDPTATAMLARPLRSPWHL